MWNRIKSWFGRGKKNEIELLLNGLKDLFKKIDDLKLAKDLNQTMDVEEGIINGLIKSPTYIKDVDLNNPKVKVRRPYTYVEDYIPSYYKISYYDLLDLEKELGSEKFIDIWYSFSNFSIPELNLEKDNKQIKFRLISVPRNCESGYDSEFEEGMKKFKEVVLDKTN